MRFPQWPRPIRQLMRPLGISADGMAAQSRFLEVISNNLANAEVTRTAEGGAYKRQVATMTPGPDGRPTLEVVQDPRPGRLQYDPSHPDANADGFVEYPNVDVSNELVDLMITRRVHEANVSVFQAAKGMLRRALEI